VGLLLVVSHLLAVPVSSFMNGVAKKVGKLKLGCEKHTFCRGVTYLALVEMPLELTAYWYVDMYGW
jgi:hypothetical protein